jgi:hypothetical protein
MTKCLSICRAFQHGDIVALASDPHGQTGTVVDVNLRVDVELPTRTFNQYYSRLHHTKSHQSNKRHSSVSSQLSISQIVTLDAKLLRQINPFREGVHVLATWKNSEWLGRVEGVRTTPFTLNTH